jgi:hypothetical protein
MVGIQRHNFAVLSWEPVAKRGAVGWNATEETPPLCPSRVASQVAVEPSNEKRHNFAVLSVEPVAKRGAVGWNATDTT